jgi:hypothetical protein
MQPPRYGTTGELIHMMSRRVCFQTNHDLTKTIMIAGTPRSGTTWLAQILAKLLHYRLIFEPWYPERVPEYSSFSLRQYVRPEDDAPAFRSFSERVLTGHISNAWTDLWNRSLLARGRIVKEVRANLFLKWIRNNFPQVPILYIIRHPCAVAHSWTKMGWGKMDVECMLSQELFVRDYLERYMGIFEKAKTGTAKCAFLWCIDQIVALSTMKYDDWLVTAYENLWRDPSNEVKRIMNYVHARYDESQIDDLVRTPAPTVRAGSAIITNRDPLESWRTELTEQQVGDILDIVGAFSLDGIYDRALLPHMDDLIRALKHESSLLTRT